MIGAQSRSLTRSNGFTAFKSAMNGYRKGILCDHPIQEGKQQGGMLYTHLCRPQKYRKLTENGEQRGQKPNRMSIKVRPEVVERRERIGDWEQDTIIGKGKQSAVISLVKRKNRFLRMGLVKNPTKDAEKDKMIKLLIGAIRQNCARTGPPPQQ